MKKVFFWFLGIFAIVVFGWLLFDYVTTEVEAPCPVVDTINIETPVVDTLLVNTADSVDVKNIEVLK